jgi:hypothetical protein
MKERVSMDELGVRMSAFTERPEPIDCGETTAPRILASLAPPNRDDETKDW